MNDSKLYINDSIACEESYIRYAGVDPGEYTLKIDTSAIRNWEEEVAEQINEAILRQINCVYVPEQKEDPKYTPNYRLGFL